MIGKLLTCVIVINAAVLLSVFEPNDHLAFQLSALIQVHMREKNLLRQLKVI